MTATANALTIDDYIAFHAKTPEERDELRTKVQALQDTLAQDPVIVLDGIYEITRPLTHSFLPDPNAETYTHGLDGRELGLVQGSIRVEESGGITELILDYRTIAKYIHSHSFSQLGKPALWLYPPSNSIAFPVDAPHGSAIIYEDSPNDIQRYNLPIEVVKGITLKDGCILIPVKTRGRTNYYLNVGLGPLSSLFMVDGLMLLSKKPKDRELVDRFIEAASRNLEYHRAA